MQLDVPFPTTAPMPAVRPLFSLLASLRSISAAALGPCASATRHHSQSLGFQTWFGSQSEGLARVSVSVVRVIPLTIVN